jgi:predicted O-linked N-acetylglucosamine transferase (SPINDLY family)
MNREQRSHCCKLSSPTTQLVASAVRLHQAEASYRQVLAVQPNLAEGHFRLGDALMGQGKLDDAVAAYRQAISMKPDFAEAHSNLGNALFGQHRLEEAVAAYRQAIGIRPDFAGAHSNLLLCLNYDDQLTKDHLLAAHREWDERYGERAPTFTTYDNDRDATRRLRIGYLSPDFRQHSVAYFVEPLLRGHDRRKVEVFCYASVTTRLRGLADQWLVTVGLSDRQLAERIRCDGIDILVDVCGSYGGQPASGVCPQACAGAGNVVGLSQYHGPQSH